MNRQDESNTTETVLYCPITPYFFPNFTEKDFYYLDHDDDIDKIEAAKLENGHSAWLDAMKSVLPHVEPRLSDVVIDDKQYDEIRSRIIGYGLDIEINNDRAWLAVKYILEGQTEPDIKRLKEYATEQLLYLDFEISPLTNMPINGGIFAMELSPADYYHGPNQYNIGGNYMLLRQELPEQKEHGVDKGKPSILAQVRETAKAIKEQNKDKPPAKKKEQELEQ